MSQACRVNQAMGAGWGTGEARRVFAVPRPAPGLIVVGSSSITVPTWSHGEA
jgi:hypothetical protein